MLAATLVWLKAEAYAWVGPERRVGPQRAAVVRRLIPIEKVMKELQPEAGFGVSGLCLRAAWNG